MFDLAGQWALTSIDGSHKASMAVPGDVHSALIAANVIAHPYIGRNEYDVRWVANDDWEITRNFQFTSNIRRGWYLDITYLDTVADVFVNGVCVLSAQNAFRRFRPDVSQALKPGNNLIRIVFHSNVKAAEKKQAEQPFFIPYSTNNCPIPNPNMLRKAQCHNGWDWNIAIAPFGLYGDIKLRPMDGARIEHVQLEQQHLESGQVKVSVIVTQTILPNATTEFEIHFAGEKRKVNSAQARHVEIFEIENPKLWWPSGSGGQYLYDLAVITDNETIMRRVGLRSIELITTPDAVGARFAVKVNGHEIFCRGANWIPADALPAQATPQLTEKLLRAAVAANMNMLRVWGGGFYEQDFFYDLCDELGILVWQDFMFACSLYPTTPEFMGEVREEVDYQVRRLGHHASMAIWCGDNELLGALTWFKESRDNRDRYLVNYDRLNRAIEETMHAADATAIWWPSSPSPGLLSFGDAWHDDRSGDMHFWSVWHEGKNFEHYRDVNPRFCSEFGFQSYPSLHIAKQFATSDDDLNISSAVMESHQKNAGGNARIAETMFRYFRFPTDFGNFCYVSQIQQGLAIKTAVEYWRSLKPHCMGALYWQLNDTWPVASWSSLDHGGGWKAMHYMAKRFYAPVVVMALPDKKTGGIIVKAVNDRLTNQQLSLKLTVLDPTGKASTLNGISAIIAADKAVEVAKLKNGDLPLGHILILDYEAADGSKGRAHFANVPYKALNFINPEITHSAKINDGKLHITLATKHAALFVTAETGVNGSYSDNVLDLLPGETAEIIFTPDNIADLDAANANLIIRNLYSSSH